MMSGNAPEGMFCDDCGPSGRRVRGIGRLTGHDGYILLIAIGMLLLAGCQGRRASDVGKAPAPPQMEASALMVKYARGFRFEKLGDETVLIIADPMRAGREIARYRLLSTGSQKKPETGYTDIRVPVTSLAASSTTHAGFLAAIDSRDRLIGCNNPERLFDTLLLDRFKKGNLVRTGRDLDYNLEFLIASKPGLVLQTGIDGRFSPDARLTESGIPVMFILEWMEPTPLGRAEWIKVFGVITGRTWEADSIFRSMESNYLNLADRGRNTSVKIKVLTGNVFKGTWYMPGGKNYMTRFFEDAGMDYIWKDNDQSSSLALSFESVVYRLADAPVWINVNVDSISELLASEERYTAFRAVREKHVYSISNRINSHGGNDFWEGGIVHPDLVLADLLAIAHPELIPDHSWNYYKPLVFD